MAEHVHIVTVDQEPCEQCMDREHRLLRLQEERDERRKQVAFRDRRLEKLNADVQSLKARNDALLEALKEMVGYAPIPMEGPAVCIYCQGAWDDHPIRSPHGTITAEYCEWVAANEAIANIRPAGTT